jgi:uncharacterized protein YfaS (alpha-2-macroglobulin family)
LQVSVKDLLAGLNKLTVNRSVGSGTLYYTAYLTAYLPVDQIKALSRGISLTRTYSLMTDPTHTPITQAKVGDAIRVSVTIVAYNDMNYVVVSDPIPAGTEAINPDLATTGSAGVAPSLGPADDPLALGFGYWYFGSADLRFDRTVLYAAHLPRSTYQFTYTLRADFAGQYHVLPTTGQQIYFPDVYGRSDAALLTILPK